MTSLPPLADNSLPSGTWRLDPTASKVHIDVKKLGFLTVTLHLTVESGHIVVEEPSVVEGDGNVSSVSVTLKAASVTSGNRKRDTEVKSAGFLDVESHPNVSFTSSDVIRSGLDFVAHGTLTIKGSPSQLSLDVTAVSVNEDAAAFNFSGATDRKAIGLGKLPSLIVSNDLHIEGSAKANLT